MGARRRTHNKQRGVQDVASAGVSASRAISESSTATIELGFDAVLAAIESLYADELKPFGRILRKRVAERAAVASGLVLRSEMSLPEVDFKLLVAICETSSSLRVVPEEGGDWSVLIIGRPETFVDIYSPVDSYPAGMWSAAAAYFQDLTGDDMKFPGGRYSCAQALQARCLDFFHGRSLGELCHIVQVAISQKKFLGYLDGNCVPYQHSQSMVKEQCAQLNAPCALALAASAAAKASGTGSNLTIATWEKARQCLREILASEKPSSDSVGTVPLSNVKRLFRSRFHTELSETMLGHSKLSELLQDNRFADICSVQLQGHGYIVVQAEPKENRTICLADMCPVYGGSTPASEPRRVDLAEFCTEEPLILDSHEASIHTKPMWPLSLSSSSNVYGRNMVQRTFIHASLPPPTPPPNARRRSSSVPKDTGSEQVFPGSQCQALDFMPQPTARTERTDSTTDTLIGSEGGDARGRSASSGEFSESCASDQFPPALEDPVKLLLRECHLSCDANVADGEPRRRLLFCEPLAMEELGNIMELEAAPCTQTPTTPYGRPFVFCPDEPLALDEIGSYAEPAFCIQTPMSPGTPYISRLVFCPDEPLALDEAGLWPDLASRTQTPARWPCLSPSVLAKDGRVGSIALSKVQNTFIHSPLVPPSPARSRARSVPRNVGSDKNALETTCQALGCNQIPRFQQQYKFSAGDCGPTPSVYGDYASHDMAWPTHSSPAFVPPSPALTASPTASPIYRPLRQFGSFTDSYHAPQSSVISLADLLH